MEEVSVVAEVNSARRLIPREEAEFLLMQMLGYKRHQLYLEVGTMSADQVRRFRAAVRKARAGMPVQYIAGTAPFLDFEVEVDSRVFIPRPETEELVCRAAARARNPEVILDYGTGTGCIAIALARIFPQAQVWAVDISRGALAVAQRNISRHRLDKRVRLIRAGSLAAVELAHLRGRVDILISNPPYIPRERLPLLDVRVRKYEPRISLDGGREGVEVVEMLLRRGPDFLAPGGLLALEIDHTQGDFVRRRLPGAEVEYDLQGAVRYLFYSRRRR